MAQTERRQQFGRARLRIAALGAMNELRQHHILDRVEIGQQVVKLIDEAEAVAPRRRARGGVLLRYLDPGNADRPAKSAFEQPHRL